jgi:hypothetical protein
MGVGGKDEKRPMPPSPGKEEDVNPEQGPAKKEKPQQFTVLQRLNGLIVSNVMALTPAEIGRLLVIPDIDFRSGILTRDYMNGIFIEAVRRQDPTRMKDVIKNWDVMPTEWRLMVAATFLPVLLDHVHVEARPHATAACIHVLDPEHESEYENIYENSSAVVQLFFINNVDRYPDVCLKIYHLVNNGESLFLTWLINNETHCIIPALLATYESARISEYTLWLSIFFAAIVGRNMGIMEVACTTLVKKMETMLFIYTFPYFEYYRNRETFWDFVSEKFGFSRGTHMLQFDCPWEFACASGSLDVVRWVARTKIRFIDAEPSGISHGFVWNVFPNNLLVPFYGVGHTGENINADQVIEIMDCREADATRLKLYALGCKNIAEAIRLMQGLSLEEKMTYIGIILRGAMTSDKSQAVVIFCDQLVGSTPDKFPVSAVGDADWSFVYENCMQSSVILKLLEVRGISNISWGGIMNALLTIWDSELLSETTSLIRKLPVIYFGDTFPYGKFVYRRRRIPQNNGITKKVLETIVTTFGMALPPLNRFLIAHYMLNHKMASLGLWNALFPENIRDEVTLEEIMKNGDIANAYFEPWDTRHDEFKAVFEWLMKSPGGG